MKAPHLAVATLAVVANPVGCSAMGSDAGAAASETVANILQPELGIDAGRHIRIDPMIESAVDIRTRARSSGLSADQIQPRAFGLILTVVHPDVEIGVAFLHQKKIYHLDGIEGRIFVDQKYFYGDGFVAPNILKTSERGWSEEYAASNSQISLLIELSTSIMRGSGHQAAYEAVASFGPLSLGGAAQSGRYERDVSWLMETQRVDSAFFFVGPAPKLGNRLATRFVNRP